MDPESIDNLIKAAPAIARGAGAVAAAVPFTAIVKRMLGPAADEVAEMWRDQVRMYRYERQLKCVEKAERMAQAAGFSSKAVPPKLLFPLLDGASLEENESLHDMWGALLANASGDATTDLVRPSFIELLKIMTPDVAKVLNGAFSDASQKAYPLPLSSSELISPERKDELPVQVDLVAEIMALTQVDLGTYRHRHRAFDEALSPSADTGEFDLPQSGNNDRKRHRFDVAMDELQRMQMWNIVGRRSGEHYYLSALAAQFVIVCRPPRTTKGK